MWTAVFCLSLGVGSGITIPVEKYTLSSNGLEVLLSHDPSLPVVAVNLWYHVGPANEPPGRTGFAHLFEHLMFQGSKYVGDDRHFELLEAAGATNVNGTTSFDRTNYFETVPSNQLETALWLEADRMGFLGPALNEAKLENQRQVVMNERRQTLDNRPYGRSNEAFYKALFKKGHPYHGYLIGSMEDIAAVTVDDARAFYERYYAPSNATLAIVGDYDPETIKPLIDRYFGSLPARSTPKPRTIVTSPITEETRFTVNEPVELARIQMGWHAPEFLTQGDAVADFLAIILGQGRTSRLYDVLVYEKELARAVAASQRSLQLKSVFSITATVRPEVPLGQLEAELQAVLEDIKDTPPTEEEMERARNQLLTDTVFSLQQVGARADRLNRYNHYRAEPDYIRRDLERYQRVTAEDVRALARELLKTDRRVVTITVPTK